MKPIEHIENLFAIKFSDTIAELINTEATFVSFPAHSIVVHEGEKSLNIYAILNGIVRGYYIDSMGNDITKCFSSENQFFSSEGLRTNSLSTFTIECMEACHCIKLSYNLVRRVMNHDELFKNKVYELYFMELSKLEKRSKDLVLMSAEERYCNFCRDYPYLNNRVSLKYIASYIGIRAASLSRIRKTLNDTYIN